MCHKFGFIYSWTCQGVSFIDSVAASSDITPTEE